MPFDERAPTPTNPWTLNNLPIVIGWIDDDRPAVLSGPQSTSDPWATEGQGWSTVHVVATQVADNIDRRGGREATLRRLAATARAHGWPWIPAATARPDGSRCALAIAVHGVPRATAVELARGAGQGVVLELGPERLRVLDLVGGQVTTVRRHHLPRRDDAAVADGPVRAAPRVAGAPPARPRPDRRRVGAGDGLAEPAA